MVYSIGHGKVNGVPDYDELGAILKHPDRHVILIPDARMTGQKNHPKLEAIKSLVCSLRPEYVLYVLDGVTRIHYAD